MTSPQLSGASPASPQFGDAQGCKQWLKNLQLTNVSMAHIAITAQLELLNRSALPPLERLKISELLREPVSFLQQELARKYSGKPVPLDEAQQNIWNSVIALWSAMGASYRNVLKSCLKQDPDVVPHLALVTHRCLHYTGLPMMEHYRAYREVDAALWRQAHELYGLAEKMEFAGRPVKDSLNKEADATPCTAAYARLLLTDLADPYRLTAKQLSQLDRWLNKWGARASITATAPEGADLVPAGVDLDSSGGPVVIEHGHPLANPRYLDAELLAATFRKRIKRLGKGESPAALGLGEDCVPVECEALLTQLYKYWFKAASKRRNFTRRPGAEKAQLVLGIPAIHFFMSGEKPFKQPGEKEKLSKREIEDLQFYGRISEQTEKLNISQLGFALETWQIEDESALGFRLARPDRDGLRVQPKQLVGLRPADSATYILGVVKWLILPDSKQFHIGISILPGAPFAVAAQPLTLGTAVSNKFAQAFLLPDMPILRETASLILPAGWFSPGKQIEIASSERYTVRLVSLIDKGSDYERVGFARTDQTPA